MTTPEQPQYYAPQQQPLPPQGQQQQPMAGPPAGYYQQPTGAIPQVRPPAESPISGGIWGIVLLAVGALFFLIGFIFLLTLESNDPGFKATLFSISFTVGGLVVIGQWLLSQAIGFIIKNKR